MRQDIISYFRPYLKYSKKEIINIIENNTQNDDGVGAMNHDDLLTVFNKGCIEVYGKFIPFFFLKI